MAEHLTMRIPCLCGSELGYITEKGSQDVVRCAACDRFAYNAPRLETGKERRSVKTREPFKPKDRARILLRAGGACELCHCSDAPLTVGHLLSYRDAKELGLSDEDANSDENLAAMCEACNSGIGRETVPLKLVLSILVARLKHGKRTEV